MAVHAHRLRNDWRPWRTLVAGLVAAFLVVGTGIKGARAKDGDGPSEEEVDYLALAARLIKDGHYDRAEVTLRQVDEAKEGIDLQRLYTLRGLVYLKSKVYAEARDNLIRAIRAADTAQAKVASPGDEKAGATQRAQSQAVLFLYLAQAHFGLKDYRATLGALGKAGPAAAGVPGTYLMAAEAHWALNEPGGAVEAVIEGQQRFPKEASFTRRHFSYLMELKLYQRALEIGQGFVSREDATETDYVAVGEALRQAGQHEKAERILEAARLRFPESIELTVQLAHTYLAAERPLTAAMLFEAASRLEPKYALEAAEVYRRAKRLERALLLNARVLDQKAKMKQRMSILLEMGRFAMVAAMEDRLARLGLLDDDAIRYALAYALFKEGDFETAEAHLKRVTSAAQFEQANELRKLMARCKAQGWECV